MSVALDVWLPVCCSEPWPCTAQWCVDSSRARVLTFAGPRSYSGRQGSWVRAHLTAAANSDFVCGRRHQRRKGQVYTVALAVGSKGCRTHTRTHPYMSRNPTECSRICSRPQDHFLAKQSNASSVTWGLREEAKLDRHMPEASACLSEHPTLA